MRYRLDEILDPTLEVTTFDPNKKIPLEHVLMAFYTNLLVHENQVYSSQKTTLLELRPSVYSSVLLHRVWALAAAKGAKCVIVNLITGLARNIEEAEVLRLFSHYCEAMIRRWRGVCVVSTMRRSAF
jgi:hypothetical protein